MCKVKLDISTVELMSSSENYQQDDHHLFVQIQPKSILKKSPSPQCFKSISTTNDSLLPSDPVITRKNTERNERFLMRSSEETDQPSVVNVLSPNYDQGKKNDIDKTRANILSMHTSSDNDDNQTHTKSIEKKFRSCSVETPLAKLMMVSRQEAPFKLFTNETNASHMTDSRIVRMIPIAHPDSSSSSFTSDDEQQQQQPRRQKHGSKLKPHKRYLRSIIAATSTLPSSTSSSDNNEQDNDEKQTGRSIGTTTSAKKRHNRYPKKDMQLDEFMRKYQQQGGICIPPTDNSDQIRRDLTKEEDRNNHHKSQGAHVQQPNFFFFPTSPSSSIGPISDDTMSILQPIDKITQQSMPVSHLQLLFDVARTRHIDRRTKIDRIRHYVEEQIGISAFLTIYKLLKSSHVPVDVRQSPFCHYATFIPHLCCLIMLESEQKNRVIQ